MRRILYVHHCPDLGGASLSLLALIDRLDRRLYEPRVLFNSLPGQAMEPFLERGIPVFQDERITTYPHGQGAWMGLRGLRPWEMVTRALQVKPSARRFRRFLEQHPCDLVHLNSSVQLPAAIGAKAAGIPLIWHVREELHPGYLGVRRAWLRHCIDRYADAVVVISEVNAGQLIPSDRVKVVYNFVDFERFDRSISGEAFRRRLGLPADRPIIGMLGGVVHSKGADVFVEAAERVLRERSDPLFLVAGLPPTGEESPVLLKRMLRRLLEGSGIVASVERRVRRLMSRRGLAESVRFVGMRRDVPEMLAACALVVWPATVSHFARPIIEAGAMALPVVASDFPSSRELVRPGGTGVLVPPSDARALAVAIARLLDGPGEARRMGEEAYRLARQRYDAVRNAQTVIALYERLLGSAASRNIA